MVEFMLELKKALIGLGVGLALVGQTYIGNCASRKDLDIPENGNIELKYECEPDVFCIKYDNGIEEAYGIIEKLENGMVRRTIRPYGLWYDKNGNGTAEDDELYFSPNMDEDWECYKKETKI
jgi:hypothetical protein